MQIFVLCCARKMAPGCSRSLRLTAVALGLGLLLAPASSDIVADVSTVAGGATGSADGVGSNAQFNDPSGCARSFDGSFLLVVSAASDSPATPLQPTLPIPISRPI